MAPLIPRGQIDVAARLRRCRRMAPVPDMRGLALAAHTAWHALLRRAADRTLLAGDALLTIR